jgi:hypothetical protein
MYIHRAAIGGNFNLTYWSSSQDSFTKAWSQKFTLSGSGGQSNDNKIAPVNHVRGVREF